MSKLKEEYNSNLKLYPLHSDYICLARAITGNKYTREEITVAFKWVDKSEYTSLDTDELIDYLFKLSWNKN